MFGISFMELVIIFVVALLVFGPKELPKIARRVGKIAGDLQRFKDAVMREFYSDKFLEEDAQVKSLPTKLAKDATIETETKQSNGEPK